jgi:hypothetical protein
MKLWKVIIKTYYFGIKHYELFVLADTESAMLRTVNQYPAVRKDEDAEIECYEQVDLTDETNRVL